MNFKQFQEKYAIVLNPQQEKAVLATKGQVLLLAVPGSGKTTVIVTRIGYMLLCLKIQPEQILTLTYSVASARDMKERFICVFGKEMAEKLEFRTIHSFCLCILREYEKQKHTTIFKILEGQEKILAKLYYSMFGEFATEAILKEIMTKISYCKNKMLTKEEIREIKVEDKALEILIKAYEEYKRKHQVMDFDDQLVYAYQILKQYPAILEKLQKQYQYIHVDEAQDTSKLQHAILRMLVKDNIFMVGDEDQSIYQFRAAYPRALLEFSKIYPHAQILLMEDNYRSTSNILEIANSFIKQNKERTDKNIKGNRGKGKPVKQVTVRKIEEQYQYLLKEVRKHQGSLAILYRNNDSAIPMIELLQQHKISFYCREQDTSFFCDKVMQDIIYFMVFSRDLSNKEIFQKIYYKMNCGISKEMLQGVLQQEIKHSTVLDVLLEQRKLPLWQVKKIVNVKRELRLLRNKNSYETIRGILSEVGYEDYLQSMGSDIISESGYQQKMRIVYWLAKQYPKVETFLKRLQELEKEIRQGNTTEDRQVVLSTIHASKGLEYDKVILIDVMEGILPSVEVKTGKIKEEEKVKEWEEQYEEEVRLFYVAMTRAKKELEMLTYQKAYESEIKESKFMMQIKGKF